MNGVIWCLMLYTSARSAMPKGKNENGIAVASEELHDAITGGNYFAIVAKPMPPFGGGLGIYYLFDAKAVNY